MRAAYLIKHGPANQAFEIRETTTPEPGSGEVRIQVEAFGLNYADVMARLGLYPAAPKPPGILGYDIAGRIDTIGKGVEGLTKGQRVAAMTRFGGYAEYACTQASGVVPLPDALSGETGTALMTQYGTAWHMAEDRVRLHEGDHVLIHAAAGGVGTALVQLARHHGCVIYGTAGSAEKLAYLQKMGVQHPINYREADFEANIQTLRGEAGLDVIFDPVGGDSIRKGMRLLGAGGRLITFGASSMSSAKNIFQKLKVGWGFGFWHPIKLLAPSKALIGVNMLALADHRPEVIRRTLAGVVDMAASGVLKPNIGGVFPIDELAEAHHLLETRQTMGKLVIRW
ncbi:MAG: zinc-binding dehydrogenase [Bacteroidota bacterium]